VKKIKSEMSFDTSIGEKVAEVEKQLPIESSDLRLKNVTSNDLILAAEMFLYLKMSHGTLKPWFIFYGDLFQQTENVGQIILTLNRLIQGSQNEIKIIARKIFKRLTNMLSLKYEEIQNLIPKRHKSEKNNKTIQSLKVEGKVCTVCFCHFIQISFHRFYHLEPSCSYCY